MITQAVILVGGRGTRLWPLTETIPKGLVPVAGVPFIEFQLRALAAVGVEEVILAVGSEHLSAWEEYASGRPGVPALTLSVESDPLDTAGAVTQALPLLGERFWVLNGDVVFDTSLDRFLEEAPPAAAVIALARVADPSAYGVVVTDDHGRVVRFVEKPAPGTAPANTVNAGIYLVEHRALHGFEAGPLSFERRVFPDLAGAKDLGAVVVSGSWLDVGTPGLYLDCHEEILAGRTSLAGPGSPHYAAPDAIIDGERRGSWSWVGPGVKVDKGAVVKESVLLDGVSVAAMASVERTIVGWDTSIGAGATISGDSILGQGCVIGAGCELDYGMRVAAGTELGGRAITFSPPP